MDNYNALSKSAILTKLALDGYFIDLLTLNSFIKSWQIEAIYENEFGIEFFDNSSYLTILNNLKDKYKKTKQSLETGLKEQFEAKEQQVLTPENEGVGKLSDTAKMPVETPGANSEATAENEPEGQYSKKVSIEELVQTAENQNAMQPGSDNTPVSKENPNIIEPPCAPVGAVEDKESFEPAIEEAIMPKAMRNIKPGPVSPSSNINTEYMYEEDTITDEVYDFTQDEIEKADSLINKQKEIKEEPKKEEPAKETKGKDSELDLMQLAQTFAQNLTGAKEGEEVAPADLEDIFDSPSLEQFEELQDYVEDVHPEYKSLEEDVPLEGITAEIKPQPVYNTPSNIQSGNLTAENVRDIIREEISRQNLNSLPVPQNGESIRDIVREIVKQTADVAPQNAFKLDISNQTLNLIAKSIAKRIAVKLNDYYKINSSKQDAKLQLFRERTIDLKEKNQALVEENKKLRVLLLESNRNLNSYKPTIFGLFKFENKKKRK